jgi:hypothetical protein
MLESFDADGNRESRLNGRAIYSSSLSEILRARFRDLGAQDHQLDLVSVREGGDADQL